MTEAIPHKGWAMDQLTGHSSAQSASTGEGVREGWPLATLIRVASLILIRLALLLSHCAVVEFDSMTICGRWQQQTKPVHLSDPQFSHPVIGFLAMSCSCWKWIQEKTHNHWLLNENSCWALATFCSQFFFELLEIMPRDSKGCFYLVVR